MKKFKVEVQELAKTDIRHARKWYNQQQSGLGKRFIDDMATTLKKIANNPTSYALRYKEIRLANFETFPYAAHFYINDENSNVYIIAILHTSRNPDTLKDRL